MCQRLFLRAEKLQSEPPCQNVDPPCLVKKRGRWVMNVMYEQSYPHFYEQQQLSISSFNCKPHIVTNSHRRGHVQKKTLCVSYWQIFICKAREGKVLHWQMGWKNLRHLSSLFDKRHVMLCTIICYHACAFYISTLSVDPWIIFAQQGAKRSK